MKKRIKTAALVGCGLFTAIITAMALIVASLEEQGQALGLTPEKILMFLAFSAVVGVSSLLISGKKTAMVKYILHFAITFAAFAVFVMAGNGLSIKNSLFLLLIVGFIIVYTLSMIARYRMRRSSKNRPQKKQDDPQSEEYKSIFKKD